jgi:hypothetical protein
MVRDETKRSAAAVADLNYVYSDEARQAVRVAIADARAVELERDAAQRGPEGDLERVEAAGERRYAAELRFALRGKGTLLDGDTYLRPGGSYDLPARLADIRAEHPALMHLDPDRARRGGDSAARLAVLATAAGIPLVVFYLLAELWSRWRHKPRGEPENVADVSMAPPVGQPAGRHRLTLVLTTIAWVLVTTLPALQLYYANREQRFQALAARQATRVTAEIQGSAPVDALRRGSELLVLTNELKAYTREFVTLQETNRQLAAQETVLAHTDQASSPALDQIAAAMSRPPAASDNVDPATRALANADPQDWMAGQRRQSSYVGAAYDASRSGNLLTLAILLAALSMGLSALAMTRSPRPRWSAFGAIGGLLALAILAAGLAALP